MKNYAWSLIPGSAKALVLFIVVLVSPVFVYCSYTFSLAGSTATVSPVTATGGPILIDAVAGNLEWSTDGGATFSLDWDSTTAGVQTLPATTASTINLTPTTGAGSSITLGDAASPASNIFALVHLGVVGTPANNSVIIDDSASTHAAGAYDFYTILGSIAGPGGTTGGINVSSFGPVNSYLIKGGPAANTYNIHSTFNATTASTTIIGGAAIDTANVSGDVVPGIGTPLSLDLGGGANIVNVGTANSLAQIFSSVKVTDTGGTTTLNLNDSADTTHAAATLDNLSGDAGAPFQVTGLSTGSIRYGAGVSALNVNGGTNAGGGVTYNVNPVQPTTPITINAGAAASDKIVETGTATTLDNLRYLPTAAGAGTVVNDSSPQPNLLFTGVEQLQLVGQIADGDGFRVDGTTGNDAIHLAPGASSDSGVFTGSMNAGAFNMTPMTYFGSDSAANDQDVNFFNPGGTDTFFVDGTSANETFQTQGGEAGGFEVRDSVAGVLLLRAEVFNISTVTINGNDGNDAFNITPSTTVATVVNGGNPVPPVFPGDTLAMNFAGTTGIVFTPGVPGSGVLSFANRQPVTFSSIEGSNADLSITNTDGVTSAPAGSTVTYTITVTNNGPNPSVGAAVTDIFPPAIANAQWTCVGTGGGTCPIVSGTGSISQLLGVFPVGGKLTYTVTAPISPSATGSLSNTATVSPTDSNPADNIATDVDTLTAPSVFVIDDVQKLEGQSGTTPFVFTVTKTGGTGFATSVQFQTLDGTATVADNDYQAASGTLNFAPFDTSKTITILVNGDANIEPNENFFVRLSPNPVNALLFDGGGQGTIINDDPAASPTPTPVPTPTPTPPNRFEGDINRTAVGVPGTGDGDVNVADQIQYLKFLNGTDCPSTNEQPRLDAGPRTTFGDGLFGSADGTAIDAYARHDASTDFDPNTPGWQPTPVGGPATITNLGCTPSAAPDSEDVSAGKVVEPESASAARVVRLVSRSGRPGSDILVDIEMTAKGNEAGTQYGLHFDPTVLSLSSISGVNTNPDIALGAGAPSGTTLNVNADDAANGNIGIVENFSAAAITALPEGATRIARVRFHVLDSAAAGTSRVDFDTSVINGVTSDVNGMVLSANYEGGDISVNSTRSVTVSGRVTSSEGRGIRGASVTIVDGDGLVRTATTSAFGYYTFNDVAAATYTIAVSSRQYRYASRSIEVSDNLADVDFTGLE